MFGSLQNQESTRTVQTIIKKLLKHTRIKEPACILARRWRCETNGVSSCCFRWATASVPIFQARALSRQQVTQPVRLRLSSPGRVTTQIGIWTFRKISPFRSKVVKNGVYALNQVCKRRLSATHHTSKTLAILKFKIRCTRHTRVSASASNTALIGSNTQRFC